VWFGSSFAWLLVTFLAFQRFSEPRGAPGFVDNPWTALPRRIVAHMLRVSTSQVRHPVLLIVLKKSDNLLFHPFQPQCNFLDNRIKDIYFASGA
jgi:hypothetical protein